ncbi:hypothetical protein [Winogradskyella sp. SM1960]|uniref:hypothetical protein n=1 Tax=Winogradskyella sp. SM1960 TaxID=2865955 RepID=UPI001CD4EF5D|nr:hypothetical protein [Winogradskyella sp. SM1960]
MFKKLIFYIPEVFLIISVLYYWSLTAHTLNPMAIGLLALLIYQIIKKNITLGLIISSVFFCLSLVLILALFSELSEFNGITQGWNDLIVFGSIFLGINLILAGFMFFKYLKLKTTKN